MSKKLQISGLVLENGKLSQLNSKLIKQFLLDNVGDIISIELKRNKKRTNPQNAYYWGVVLPLIRNAINELGNEFSIEDTHEYLKLEFNTKEVIVIDELKVLPQSTAKLTTEEFTIYLEKCIKFAAEILGIVIPLPNE